MRLYGTLMCAGASSIERAEGANGVVSPDSRWLTGAYSLKRITSSDWQMKGEMSLKTWQRFVQITIARHTTARKKVRCNENFWHEF